MKRFLFICVLFICIFQFMKPAINQVKTDLDAQLRPLGINSVEELITHPDRVMERTVDNFFKSISY